MTIKEFARLCRCNPQTLRYYDHVELLKPGKVDQWSGYRYYEEEQALAFVRIKNLQKAGFTIEEIKELLDKDNAVIYRAFEAKIAEEEKRLQKIKAIQKSYQAEMTDMQKKLETIRNMVKESMEAYDPAEEFGLDKNNYSLMVYNGDIGYINSIEHDIISVYFPDYGRTAAYMRNQARDLTLAYAVTIHKAQGSETEAVVVVMDKSNSANAVRKHLYTAVTRARKAVVLIGEREAFRNALANKKAVHRNTELANLLREKFKI